MNSPAPQLQISQSSWQEKVFCQFGVIALLTTAFLAHWSARVSRNQHGWIDAICAELAKIFTGPTTQWQVVLCLIGYLVGFTWLARIHEGAIGYRRMLVLILVSIASCAYVIDYPESTKQAGFLSFLFAIVGSQALSFWLRWKDRNPNDFNPYRAILNYLAILILAFAFLDSEQLRIYKYRGVVRWTGMWSTPNVYGILMASAVSICICRILEFFHDTHSRKVSRYTKVATSLWMVGGVAAAGCLLQSYSRGAWLGAGIAGLYIIQRYGLLRRFSTRNVQLYLAVILFSFAIIGFWCLRHSESHTVRRVFTVLNPNDFSWRNRLAVVPGAVHAMAERPIRGYGWNIAESTYVSVFHPKSHDEGYAITQNDFVMIALTMGLPAAVIFFLYVLGTFTKAGIRPTCLSSPRGQSLIVAMAAILPMFVGLMFDGALSNTAIAVPFFCLLEMYHHSNTSSNHRAVKD